MEAAGCADSVVLGGVGASDGFECGGVSNVCSGGLWVVFECVFDVWSLWYSMCGMCIAWMLCGGGVLCVW